MPPARTAAVTDSIAGRAPELTIIDRLLDLNHQDGERVLAIEGPAGIGKSSLLRVAVRKARAAGWATAVARSDEFERDYAFGVARQLFERLLREERDDRRAELLAGPAALAAPVLDPLSTTVPDELSPVLHGLYWLAADISAARPLLLAVDDLQWTDALSQRWLRYLGRRIDGHPIVLLVTSRPHPDTSLGQGKCIVLGGLDEESTEAIGTDVLGEPGERAFWSSCHAATHGNPFLLHALLRSCLLRGVRPTGAAADRIGEFGPPEVADLARAVLDRAGPDAAPLARALAVIGDGHDVPTLAAASGLTVGRVSDLVHQLARLDLLRRSPAGVRFTHAIVSAAIAADVLPSDREVLLLRAATLLRERGEPAERVAALLLPLRGPGEPWVVEVLRTASADAARTGGPESGTRYLQRALRESLSTQDKAALLLDLGRSQHSTSLPDAIGNLAASLDLTAEPRERAKVAQVLATAQYAGGAHADAIETLRRAAEVVRPVDPDRALNLEVQRAHMGLVPITTHALARNDLSDIEDAIAQSRDHDDEVLARLRGIHGAASGESAADSLAWARRVPADHAEPLVRMIATTTLATAGCPEEALELCDAAVESARAKGSQLAYSAACTMRTDINTRLGRIGEAQADAEAALQASQEIGIGAANAQNAVPIGCMVNALTARGDRTEARAVLDRHGLSGAVPPYQFYYWVLLARGRLRRAEGSPAEALVDFEELGRRLLRCEIVNPAAFPWRSEAALALAELGRQAEALALAEDEVRLARRWGAAHTVGVALRTVGVLTNHVATLRAATDLLVGSAAKLDLAGALADLGKALRVSGDNEAARQVLRHAVEVAGRCGATVLVDGLLDELRAAGARPRPAGMSGIAALTPTERRVARLAARGLTNRDIAQRLFVGLRTVEIHLTNAYRKLAVSGRAGLPRELTDEAGG